MAHRRLLVLLGHSRLATNADLIVMGADGHSRRAGRVLGAATRGSLALITVPEPMSQ